jgi:two-component system, OmpR family, alkaline phosphatase synthesis response regulator PhoP
METMPRKKILVIEDELALLETIRIRLDAEGYDAIVADNGKDGVLKALSEKPDLILVDIMMPEMDGIEVIRILHSTGDFRHIPMIVISALGRDSDIKKAMDAGAEDYMVKPYSQKELLKKIAHFLE